MADGIRIPVAISGITLLVLIAGGGGLLVKVDRQQDDIAKLEAAIQNDEAGQTLAGLAECRANIVALVAADARHETSINALWRTKASKPSREDER